MRSLAHGGMERDSGNRGTPPQCNNIPEIYVPTEQKSRIKLQKFAGRIMPTPMNDEKEMEIYPARPCDQTPCNAPPPLKRLKGMPGSAKRHTNNSASQVVIDNKRKGDCLWYMAAAMRVYGSVGGSAASEEARRREVSADSVKRAGGVGAAPRSIKGMGAPRSHPCSCCTPAWMGCSDTMERPEGQRYRFASFCLLGFCIYDK